MIGDNYVKISPHDRWIIDASANLAGASLASGSNKEGRFLTAADYTSVHAALHPTSSIMFLGDSLTSYGVSLRSFLLPDEAMVNTPVATYTTLNAAGVFVRNTQFDLRDTPVGAGTLRYYSGGSAMTWQSFGDTEGARVNVGTGGSFYLPSGTAGGAYVQLTISFKPTGNAADAITVTSSISNSWGFLNGYAGAWEVYNGNPFDKSYFVAISGCTTTDIVLWQNQWVSIYSDITVIEVGTNNTSSIAANAQNLADIQNIVRRRQEIGSIPIVMGLFPNASGSLTEKRADMDLNNQLALWCRANGIRFVDTYQLLSDWTTQNPGVRTNCFGVDNLHTSALGGYLVQKYGLGPLLNPLVSALIPQYSPSSNSAYDATLAPRENLLTNGGLAGTAGATVGAGASGTAPSNWDTHRTAGSTVTVVSSAPASGGLARTDGPPQPFWKLQIDNTGGAANEVIAALQTAFVSASNYAVGDDLVFSGEISVAVTTPGMMRITAAIIGTNLNHQAIGATVGFEMFDQYGKTEVFKFRTRPLAIPPAGVANMNCRLEFYMQANGVATVGIGPMALTKII